MANCAVPGSAFGTDPRATASASCLNGGQFTEGSTSTIHCACASLWRVESDEPLQPGEVEVTSDATDPVLDRMVARAEALTDRRVASTSVHAAIAVGLASIVAAMAAALPSSAMSALSVSLVAALGALISTLWLRSNRWYGRATDLWFQMIREREERAPVCNRLFVQEYDKLYASSSTPSRIDDLVAYVVLVAMTAACLAAVGLAIARI